MSTPTRQITVAPGLVLHHRGRAVATITPTEAFDLAQELTSLGFEQICRDVADREFHLAPRPLGADITTGGPSS